MLSHDDPLSVDPNADLTALERELEELLVRFEVLDATWRKALRQVYGSTREQRCWAHKTDNVLNKLPKSCLSRRTALAMVFKLCQSAQGKWRKLNGSDQLAEIIRGARFVEGEPQDRAAA